MHIDVEIKTAEKIRELVTEGELLQAKLDLVRVKMEAISERVLRTAGISDPGAMLHMDRATGEFSVALGDDE